MCRYPTCLALVPLLTVAVLCRTSRQRPPAVTEGASRERIIELRLDGAVPAKKGDCRLDVSIVDRDGKLGPAMGVAPQWNAGGHLVDVSGLRWTNGGKDLAGRIADDAIEIKCQDMHDGEV